MYVYFSIFIYLLILLWSVCACVWLSLLWLFAIYFFLFLSILYGVYTRDCSCIDKSMQIVLKRDSIHKPLTFNICLLQQIFHSSVFTTYAANVFSIQIFQYLHQILPRVCTLVLFINYINN